MVAITTAADGEREKSSHVRKGSLTSTRRQLIGLMQETNFGRIEHIGVRDGEPYLAPLAAMIKEIKFGAENGSRRELALDDFVLKSQIVEMFEHFDQFRNFHIDVLEVKHGLPFRMMIRAGIVLDQII